MARHIDAADIHMTQSISGIHLHRAARVVHAGGVIAYPTEGVFGLGCDPENVAAVERILTIKQRPVSAGLILIAADRAQLDDWIAPTADEESALNSPAEFVTWIVTAGSRCPEWITGFRPTCAVRITRHPIAASLCRNIGLPLVSTSANRHGQPAALNGLTVRRTFGDAVDWIVPGATGGASGASEIRVASGGVVLRGT